MHLFIEILEVITSHQKVDDLYPEMLNQSCQCSTNHSMFVRNVNLIKDIVRLRLTTILMHEKNEGAPTQTYITEVSHTYTCTLTEINIDSLSVS